MLSYKYVRYWGGVVFPVLNFKVLIKAERLFTKLNGERGQKKKPVSIHSWSSLLIFIARVSGSLLIELQ